MGVPSTLFVVNVYCRRSFSACNLFIAKKSSWKFVCRRAVGMLHACTYVEFK